MVGDCSELVDVKGFGVFEIITSFLTVRYGCVSLEHDLLIFYLICHGSVAYGRYHTIVLICDRLAEEACTVRFDLKLELSIHALWNDHLSVDTQLICIPVVADLGRHEKIGSVLFGAHGDIVEIDV